METLSNRFVGAERIVNLEYMSFVIPQSDKKRLAKIIQIFQNFVKWQNIHVLGVAEWMGNKWFENTFNDKISGRSYNLEKVMNIRMHEVHRTPNRFD